MPRGVKVRVLSWAMHKNSSAALAVVLDKSKTFILLVKRRDVPMWVLPGGGVEEQESTETAATREVLEETGIHATSMQLAAEYSTINFFTRDTTLYTAIAKDGPLFKTNESLDSAFFRPEEFPDNTFMVHKHWIMEILKAKEVIRRPLNEVSYWNVFKYLIRDPLLFFRYLSSWLGFPINS